MKSEYMKTANQKSRFQSRSNAFKEVHRATKGTMVHCIGNVVTNKQKCILHGVQSNGISEENQTVESVEELNLNFGV